MENQLDPDEDLKASTELLRLKLELEHNMVFSDTSKLSAEIENKWLTNIYNFEQQYKQGKRTKVYNMLGQPEFPKWNDLDKNQISRELVRVLALMEEKHIVLDCCVEYDDALIYQFITEELFQHEMDDIFIDGMIQHFIYEEFHPNHEYDLKRKATDFVNTLLTGKWNEEYDKYSLCSEILFKSKMLERSVISSMIISFQEAYKSFEIGAISIKNVAFDLQTKSGKVVLDVAYVGYADGISSRSFVGPCVIEFEYDLQYPDWNIKSFEFPGFEN